MARPGISPLDGGETKPNPQQEAHNRSSGGEIGLTCETSLDDDVLGVVVGACFGEAVFFSRLFAISLMSGAIF